MNAVSPNENMAEITSTSGNDLLQTYPDPRIPASKTELSMSDDFLKFAYLKCMYNI